MCQLQWSILSSYKTHLCPRVTNHVTWFDLELEQLDVKMIFFLDEFEEQIFMRQPEGFVKAKKIAYASYKKISL